MSVTTPDTVPEIEAPAAIKGRSLWQDAWNRLLRNRAAVVSAIILGFVALFCFLGPLVTPHRFDGVYQAYIKVPASFDPYPHVRPLEQVLDRALRPSGARVTHWSQDPSTGQVTVEIGHSETLDVRAVESALEFRGYIESFDTIGVDEGAGTLSVVFDPVAAAFMVGDGPDGEQTLVRVDPIPQILNRALRQYDATPVAWQYGGRSLSVTLEGEDQSVSEYLIRRSLDRSSDLMAAEVLSVTDGGQAMDLRLSFVEGPALEALLADEIGVNGVTGQVLAAGGNLTLSLRGEDGPIDGYVLVEDLGQVDDLITITQVARDRELPGYPAIEGGYYLTLDFSFADSGSLGRVAAAATGLPSARADRIDRSDSTLRMVLEVNAQLDPQALINILSFSSSELFDVTADRVAADGRSMDVSVAIRDADPTDIVELAMQRIDVNLIDWSYTGGVTALTLTAFERLDTRTLVEAITRNDDLFTVDVSDVGADGRSMAIGVGFVDANPARELRRILRRADAELVDWSLDTTTKRIAVTAADPLDQRLLVNILEREDELYNVRLVDVSSDGRTMTIAADVEERLFLLGTDSNGRDLMTRVMMGGRISLMIGLAASAVSLLIGVAWGATAGYLGGRADTVMMRIVDILYSLPFMFFVILLMVFFGRNIFLMFIALGAVEWLDMARIVRGQTLSIKRKEFIEAAHAAGVRTAKIIRRHIVPNALGPVVVYMTLTVPRVILIESFLSFLGLGVQEPMTSWGVLIADGANNMEGALWMLAFPAGFLAVTLFCLNFIGDGLRDALDPKDR